MVFMDNHHVFIGKSLAMAPLGASGCLWAPQACRETRFSHGGQFFAAVNSNTIQVGSDRLQEFFHQEFPLGISSGPWMNHWGRPTHWEFTWAKHQAHPTTGSKNMGIVNPSNISNGDKLGFHPPMGGGLKGSSYFFRRGGDFESTTGQIGTKFYNP